MLNFLLLEQKQPILAKVVTKAMNDRSTKFKANVLYFFYVYILMDIMMEVNWQMPLVGRELNTRKQLTASCIEQIC